ncbi:hypothetical protein [Plantactinospora sp. GCM10030261]|uniref:hypothetical protein n=1 Tax=Plantactinospora sp. GCM10030261 TaxID=3273420 RepID=UPI003618EBBA
MNVPAAQVPRRPSPPSLLPMVLAIALLIPVAVLFAQDWSKLGDDRLVADRERDGIAYLRVLGPVTVALVDAQVAAVSGQSAPREALDRAVREVNAVDAQLGADLRTTERWSGLRSRIETLPSRPSGGAPEALSAFQEATDLLLALYGKVQSSSGLDRDPDTDAAQLQQVVARDLPTALVGTGLLTSMAVLAPARPASERSAAAGDLGTAQVMTFAAVQDLVTNMQEAIDSSQSTNLGGNVLSRLDAYQRALASLSAAVTPPTTGARATQLPDASAVASARVAAQAAGADLATIILAELDTLVEERADDLDTSRWIAIGAVIMAILLVAAAVVGTVLARRRYRRAVAIEARRVIAEEAGIEPPGGAGAPERAGAGPNRTPGRERWQLAALAGTPDRGAPSTEWPEPVPVGPNTRSSAGTVRDNQPAHWGRNDAR